MKEIVKRFEPLIIAALLVWGAAFLLRLPYLRFWVSLPVCVSYLWAIHAYVSARYEVKIPVTLLFLVWASVAIDCVGNLRFGDPLSLYDRKFTHFQYDEFAHTVIPALVAPVIVWLLRAGLARFG